MVAGVGHEFVDVFGVEVGLALGVLEVEGLFEHGVGGVLVEQLVAEVALLGLGGGGVRYRGHSAII